MFRSYPLDMQVPYTHKHKIQTQTQKHIQIYTIWIFCWVRICCVCFFVEYGKFHTFCSNNSCACIFLSYLNRNCAVCGANTMDSSTAQQNMDTSVLVMVFIFVFIFDFRGIYILSCQQIPKNNFVSLNCQKFYFVLKLFENLTSFVFSCKCTHVSFISICELNTLHLFINFYFVIRVILIVTWIYFQYIQI